MNVGGLLFCVWLGSDPFILRSRIPCPAARTQVGRTVIPSPFYALTEKGKCWVPPWGWLQFPSLSFFTQGVTAAVHSLSGMNSFIFGFESDLPSPPTSRWTVCFPVVLERCCSLSLLSLTLVRCQLGSIPPYAVVFPSSYSFFLLLNSKTY